MFAFRGVCRYNGRMKDADDFTPATMREEFAKVYGGSADGVRVFASPARINIIGEHIDYNGGKVFPAAIDRYLYVAIRARGDDSITCRDLKFPGVFKFSARDEFSFKKENDYANYLNGILSIMRESGRAVPSGFDVLLASNVPPAGGISSSSALECGFAWALSELFGLNFSRKEIALIGQRSEHEFMNVNCGIMDQFIIATAKKGTAELLDCATLECEYVPLDLGDCRFVVMNTKKKRQLADSKYNERRAECEKALSILREAAIPIEGGSARNTRDLPNLCSLSSAQLDECKGAIADKTLLARVRHCVTENERVERAARAMKAGDLALLGSLLKESHESLKSDYCVTGAELDALADAANSQDGCLGARMTGAGFGGCAIALVKDAAIDGFISATQSRYTAAIGHDAGFFACRPGDGVHEV